MAAQPICCGKNLGRRHQARRNRTGNVCDARCPAFVSEKADVVVSWRERFVAISPEGCAACCAAIRDMDLREAIGAIGAPTLIIAGRRRR